jgi:uncharacterized membrane protein YfcA
LGLSPLPWGYRQTIPASVMKLIIPAILTGLAAGLLGALCGVGGGILMVPAFVGLLKLEHKQAVATSMAVIIVTAIAATLNNARTNQLIKWEVVATVGLASAVAAWFGSDLMRNLSNQTLTRIFGCLLVVFGARMLWKG